MKLEKLTILGIDPGYDKLGIAVVEKEGGKKENLIYSACIKTARGAPFNERLMQIAEIVEATISAHSPVALAIEKLFFTTNQKTAMQVSEVRGLIIYLATKNNLQIFEYTPSQVKSTIAGSGNASKDQIINMVPRLIKLNEEIKEDDEYDAIALALSGLACEKLF